jgi:hypothetical protein
LDVFWFKATMRVLRTWELSMNLYD